MISNLAKKNLINTFLNTYFNLFVIIFVSFLMFASYLFILQPKIEKTTSAISENISSQQKLLQAQKTKLANLKKAIASYDSIDKVDSERINRILPDDYNKELLYGEIEELITRNGFVPSSISLNKEGEGAEVKGAAPTEAAKISDKIGVINISLGIASVDYAGLKNLLNILENNLRLLDVKQVSLSGGQAGSLEFSTYYYKK